MKQGQALLALTFKRHTATIVFVAVWTVLLATFASVLRGLPPPILLAASMPAVGQWLVLVAQVSYPQADLTASGSGYPEYLLRLPLTARTLALWPVLATIGASLGLWLGLAYGFYARVGIPVPVDVAFGMVAAFIGAVFLISWRPFVNGLLRLLSLAAALVAIVVLRSWLNLPAYAYFTLAVLEVVLSPSSVQLARRNISVASRSSRSLRATKDRRFSSPKEAMFWMEWKLRGRPFPVTVAVFAVVLSIPLTFMSGVPGELAGFATTNGWIPMGLPVLVLGTVAISMIMRPDGTITRNDRSTFFLTLPVSNSYILRAKHKEQSAGVLIATAVVLVALFCWLLLPPEPFLGQLWQKPQQLLATCLEGALLVGLMWRSRTVWTFAACCRDEARSKLISIGAMAIPVVTMLPVGVAIDSGFTLKGLLPFVPWVLATLLIVRLLLAYRIAERLSTLSAAEGMACRRLAARWVVTSILLWAILVWLLSLQPSTFRVVVFDPILVALLVALAAAPLVRPLLARQYLYLARHG